MLAAYQLTVRSGSATLLSEVSVAVPAGQVVAIVGPNGAGKSTLLRALAGDITPIAGDIVLEDRPLTIWRGLDLARIRAVVLQHGRFDFGFSALEVALLGRAPHAGRVSRTRDIAIAAAALLASDAAHLRSRSYPTLSAGEQQRVQLARALAQVWDVAADAPRYLLLDEPTSALDLAHQHRTLQCLREWALRGAGVLVVLHDLNLAAIYADRILVLRGGRPAACGPPAQVLTPGVVEAAFDVRVALVDVPELGHPLLVPHAPHARRSASRRALRGQ